MEFLYFIDYWSFLLIRILFFKSNKVEKNIILEKGKKIWLRIIKKIYF